MKCETVERKIIIITNSITSKRIEMQSNKKTVEPYQRAPFCVRDVRIPLTLVKQPVYKALQNQTPPGTELDNRTFKSAR